MKILVGKAKECFDKWLQTEMIVLPENGFEGLGDAFKNTLIIQWLDSIGVITHVNCISDSSEWYFEILTDDYMGGMVKVVEGYDEYTSRFEAIEASIIKSVELFNLDHE